MEIVTYIPIAALLPMALFAKDPKEETFWKWFEKNQDDLYHSEEIDAPIPTLPAYRVNGADPLTKAGRMCINLGELKLERESKAR